MRPTTASSSPAMTTAAIVAVVGRSSLGENRSESERFSLCGAMMMMGAMVENGIGSKYHTILIIAAPRRSSEGWIPKLG